MTRRKKKWLIIIGSVLLALYLVYYFLLGTRLGSVVSVFPADTAFYLDLRKGAEMADHVSAGSLYREMTNNKDFQEIFKSSINKSLEGYRKLEKAIGDPFEKLAYDETVFAFLPSEDGKLVPVFGARVGAYLRLAGMAGASILGTAGDAKMEKIGNSGVKSLRRGGDAPVYYLQRRDLFLLSPNATVLERIAKISDGSQDSLAGTIEYKESVKKFNWNDNNPGVMCLLTPRLLSAPSVTPFPGMLEKDRLSLENYLEKLGHFCLETGADETQRSALAFLPYDKTPRLACLNFKPRDVGADTSMNAELPPQTIALASFSHRLDFEVERLLDLCGVEHEKFYKRLRRYTNIETREFVFPNLDAGVFCAISKINYQDETAVVPYRFPGLNFIAPLKDAEKTRMFLDAATDYMMNDPKRKKNWLTLVTEYQGVKMYCFWPQTAAHFGGKNAVDPAAAVIGDKLVVSTNLEYIKNMIDIERKTATGKNAQTMLRDESSGPLNFRADMPEFLSELEVISKYMFVNAGGMTLLPDDSDDENGENTTAGLDPFEREKRIKAHDSFFNILKQTNIFATAELKVTRSNECLELSLILVPKK